MNVKQGAFRLWVVVAVLWIGHLGWAKDEGHSGLPWFDIVSSSFADNCWASRQAWVKVPPVPLTPELEEKSKTEGLSDDEVFGPDGLERYNADIKCEYEVAFPRQFLPRLLMNAVSLPVGLLVLWFIVGWVRAGFRLQPGGAR
jgi:hypothetical protein